ncbi:AraC family transcriptional regulator [Halomonas sp. ISL-56]|uniref:AraC family transcriptional regulator n=1 Tax=Halomonas sp. ISL-56 TaxID=2819149 RepID=UPI0020355B4A|nr:AraC family transcriptional regulator [Halomonas sp. ISL-56]
MNNSIEKLRSLVEKRAKSVLTQTHIPRLDILRVCEPTELFPEIYQPLISLILQGSKRIVIGDQVVNYQAGQSFVTSVELPVIGEVVESSPTTPYLALRLSLDRALVTEMLCKVDNPLSMSETRGFCIDRVSDDLADAWYRMVRLTDHPEDIALIAPLIEREILYRMLRGPQGAVLRQIAGIDDRFFQIRSAITWIRKNYATAFRVEELAATVNMSPSAFHRRFKATVRLSPLQYQKQIRLYEARRMLFTEPGGVTAVALSVGYESLSQFSREYSRLFGAPPARDIRTLRQDALGGQPTEFNEPATFN